MYIQSFGYVKYKMSNSIRKGRGRNTQFKASKQNYILDLIDTCRIVSKVVYTAWRENFVSSDS